jgi:acyl-CoA dehydrogenase
MCATLAANRSEYNPPIKRTGKQPGEVPAAAAATYLCDLQELEFYLWDVQKLDNVLGQPPFRDLDRHEVRALLEKAAQFARKLSTAYQSSDRYPAHLRDDGTVAAPPGFEALWKECRAEWQWLRRQSETLADSEPSLPQVLNQIILEMFVGANPSLMSYGGFTPAALTLLELSATPEQRAAFEPELRAGRWDATFCATEAQAGSDLSGISTSAAPIEGEVYAIRGEKKYITAGMHPLVENTVHLVLARIEGSQPGFFSLSCFLVPRYRREADGMFVDNNVRCARVERKMGLKGVPNTLLQFGEAGETQGYLLGGRKNVALLQLTPLMRRARIGTSQIAIGLASSAYLHSLTFARERIQGRRFEESASTTAQPVAIIEHADVQRMLLDMKARVEGCRGIIGKLTREVSQIQILKAAGAPRSDMERSARLVTLYTPIVKAYVSDQAWLIATTAIQVHGGEGYLADRPIEQYARDIKILSIWEGTNYIQSQDLVRDKLGLGRNAVAMRFFLEDINAFIAGFLPDVGLDEEVHLLADCANALKDALDGIRDMASDGSIAQVPYYSKRFLDMFGDVLAAWVLLENACAAQRLLTDGTGTYDRAFLTGKIKTARYFVHEALPTVLVRAAQIAKRVAVPVASNEFGFPGQVGVAL